MSVRVNFEIGHKASIRTKATPEGFTHDWEVYVKGSENHDIGHFVEKVVFYLHETFPKPKRVVKESPFSVKESGYAGFVIPIEVYLKNKDEPKKIKFQYDLVLQQSGPDTLNRMNEQYVFHNPNEDFKKKLLKGGGFITNSSSSFLSHEERSRDSFSDDKPQLMSKPKLSGEVKKHKIKDKYDVKSSNFVNLFGTPLHKPSKISPEPKKVNPPAVPPIQPPPTQPKLDKKDKEKSSGDKEKSKSKYEHKEKDKKKEDKDKPKEDKVKSHKETEKPKDKSVKRPIDHPQSPSLPQKKKFPSPSRRPPSPIKTIAPPREEPKVQKLTEIERKSKDLVDSKSDRDKKPKKDKKSYDKDKERKKDKDHKKEAYKVNKEQLQKELTKPKDTEVKKEREFINELPPSTSKEKPQKPDKSLNKFSIENMIKRPESKPDDTKSKEKHKHKKKDKKRDESREKHKEKKHKHDRTPKEIPPEHKEPLLPAPEPELEPEEDSRTEDRSSPISVSSRSSSKSDQRSKLPGLDDISGTSDSASDSGPDDDDPPFKKITPIRQPETPKREPKLETPPPPEEDKAGPSKEKPKKHKDKKRDSDDKKHRKRKSSIKEEEPENKMAKGDISKRENAPSGSRLNKSETKLQDNGVSSSLGEEGEASGAETETETRGDIHDITPDAGDLSPDYMLRLKDLQQRIMMIKSNEELERVVNLIAETGRYEVTTQTFDFDLCLLDRSTVQQLIALIG